MTTNILWGVLRLLMGWTFLWAFLDKLLGLGFTTCRNPETNIIEYFCNGSWLNGGSPTTGFLKFGTIGPFASFYQSLAGIEIIDWLYMLGLFGVGLALMLGVATRFASYTGASLMVLFYTASAILPEHNPLIDEHVVYFFLLLGFASANAGQYLGLGKWWAQLAIVKKYPILN